jgi:hypothetical protein
MADVVTLGVESQDMQQHVDSILSHLERTEALLPGLDEEEDETPPFEDGPLEEGDDTSDDLQFIHDIISSSTCLMDLGPTLERLVLDRVQDEEEPKTGESLEFRVSGPAASFVNQVRDKFKTAKDTLVERLGKRTGRDS